MSRVLFSSRHHAQQCEFYFGLVPVVSRLKRKVDLNFVLARTIDEAQSSHLFVRLTKRVTQHRHCEPGELAYVFRTVARALSLDVR